MVGVLIQIKDLIWLLRAALILVAGVGVYLETQGNTFFQNMAYDHITTSSTLIFLSIFSFIQPLIKIKKKNVNGGETTLKKLNITLGAVIAVLSVMLYLTAFHNELVVGSLIAMGGGLGATIINGIVAVTGNIIYQTYGYPIGIISGITFTWLATHIILPKIKRTPKAQVEFQGAPTYTPTVTPVATQKVTPEPKKE